MNEDHTHSFKDAFGKFLKEEHLEKRYRQKELIDKWPKIMGHTIASRTSKVFFRGDTLYIEFTSASLKDEMNRSRVAVQERLTEHFGEQIFTEIRFI